MKLRCAHCNKPGDPNPQKVTAHKKVCTAMTSAAEGEGNNNVYSNHAEEVANSEKIVNESQDMMKKVDSLNDEKAELKKELEEKNHLNKNLSEDLDSLENNMTEIVEKFNALEVEIGNIEDEKKKMIEELKNVHLQDEKNNKNFTIKLREVEEEKNENHQKYLIEKEKNVKLVNELKHSKKKKDSYKNELVKIKESFSKTVQDLESIKEHTKHMEDEKAKMAHNVEKQTEQIDLKMRKVKEENKDITQKYLNEKEKNMKLAGELNTYKHESDEVEKERNEKMRKAINELQRMKQEKNEHYETQKMMSNRISELRQSIIKLKENLKVETERRRKGDEILNQIKGYYSKAQRNRTEEMEKGKEILNVAMRLNGIGGIDVDSEDWGDLGVGGFGQVFKAKQNGCNIAIKKAKDRDAMECVEALIISSLTHPNVIKVNGFRISSETLMYSMECMDMDLDKFLDLKSNDKEIAWRINAILDSSKAVDYIHAQGIIHRDIKPQNFLVKEGNSGVRLVLCDFGLAHVGKVAKGFAGTRGYVAPEMYDDDYVYNSKVDDWSLGAVLYEVITDDTLVKNLMTGEEEVNPKAKWEEAKVHMPKEVGAVKGLLTLDPKKRTTAGDLLKLIS